MAWLPYVLLAMLAGVVNTLNAWKQLSYDCRFLIYFRPSRVLGVYLWTAVQLAFPAVLAWVVLKFADHPPIDLPMVGKAVGMGVAFVALMNATTQIAGFNIDQLRKIYNWFINLAKDRIAARETARTALFWQKFQNELMTLPSLEEGIVWLRNYVDADISLSRKVRTATLASIKRVASIKDRAQQAALVKPLLAVRRRDLPVVLQHFGCSQELIGSLIAKSR